MQTPEAASVLDLGVSRQRFLSSMYLFLSFFLNGVCQRANGRGDDNPGNQQAKDAGSLGGSTRQLYFPSLVETGLIVQVEHALRNEGIELRSKVLREPR